MSWADLLNIGAGFINQILQSIETNDWFRFVFQLLGVLDAVTG